MDTVDWVHERIEHLAFLGELAIEQEIDFEVEENLLHKINEVKDWAHSMKNWLWPDPFFKPYTPIGSVQSSVDETIKSYSTGSTTEYNKATGTKEFFIFYHHLIKDGRTQNWIPPISHIDWTMVETLLNKHETSSSATNRENNTMEQMFFKLNNDIVIPRLCLLQSFLRRQGQNEMGKRSVLYRIQKKYQGWENDFWVGNFLALNRFTSACKPEGGKTFLTNDEFYKDEHNCADVFREMEVVIYVEPRVRCAGVDITEKSAYENYQREVLFPAGAQFLITNVEHTGSSYPEIRIEMKALDPST